MDYHHVVATGLDPAPDRPSTKRSISDAGDRSNLAARVYEDA